MILLPKNVEKVADLASRESGRYSMCAVRVREFSGDRYRLEATDGKALAIVTGDGVPRDKYPAPAVVAKLESALPADPTFDYLVPVGEWGQGFKLAGKGGCLGVAGSANKVVLAGPTGIVDGPQMEGRFPDTKSVIESARKRTHGVSVRLTPKLLARLLNVAAEFTDDGTGAVELVVSGPNDPVILLTHNGSGQTFDALIMPCS